MQRSQLTGVEEEAVPLDQIQILLFNLCDLEQVLLLASICKVH